MFDWELATENRDFKISTKVEIGNQIQLEPMKCLEHGEMFIYQNMLSLLFIQ